ncbi:unnamed protein product [Soboliphyme baturini]|uniref:Transmembrane protein n=1 Tax=Soboliphyme baturini TaxID=241478 RepID=A0A183J1D0_9BILA|nr:unnamed protein product [Soboliphyme baturini]
MDVFHLFGISVFELFMHALSLLIFTILLTAKLEAYSKLSWWLVFSPLFVACFFNAYFSLIVFLRQYFEERSLKPAATRSLWVGVLILLLVTFEVLVCASLNDRDGSYSYGAVFCPVYIIMGLLLLKACVMH